MIRITLRSGRYTKEQLDHLLSSYFEEQRDIDLFIEALMDTGQVTKEEDSYVFPEERKVTRNYPSYHELSTYYYGGGNRVGVRGGSDWTKRYGFPSNMYLSKIFVDGKWIDIKEKPSLELVKGRGYGSKTTVEKWRAQIPVAIQHKYNITPGIPIRTAVTQQTFNYYAQPQLWGYSYRVMVAYGETKGGANPRNLEIGGHNFVNKISKDISDSIERDQERIRNTILALLERGDAEYFGLYAESEDADRTAENVSVTPLVNLSRAGAVVELTDLKNRRIIIDWTAQEKQSIPKVSEFVMNSHVDSGLAMTRGQTQLELKWKNRGGFK